MYEVGQEVRVSYIDFSKVGTIACINSNQTVDVIFKQSQIDEDDISIERIKAIESFELIEYSDDPFILKDHGNILFGLRDFEKAIHYYNYGLQLLLIKSVSVSIGSSIIIQSQSRPIDFHVAMIITEDENTYEIEIEETEECINISKNDIILLTSEYKIKGIESNELNKRILQRSFYINLSRCYMKLHKYGWTVRFISLSIATTKSIESIDSNNQNIIKYMKDEYYIRVKALLAAGRLQLAYKDIEKLMKLKDILKSNELLKELNILKIKRKNSNKKMIKSLMNWVSNTISNSNLNNQFNDMDIMPDDEED